MRRTLAAVLVALAAASAVRAQADAGAAREELQEGARLYRDGRFAEAERHFRRALELDPEVKNVRLFIARAIHLQYRPGFDAPENVATGERAAAAYREILDRDPQDEDAYKALLSLYGQMRRDEKVEELLTRRANDSTLPASGRAEALAILAGRRWQCSYDITEQKENWTSREESGRAVTRYRMPAGAGDFAEARRCADEGLRLAEQAVALDPGSPSAWSYEANLLREESKLAEMEGDAARKAEFDGRRREALDARTRLSAEAQRRAREELLKSPAPAAEPAAAEPAHKKTLAAFAVLNGRAVSKPEPDYPLAAKAAGAEGTVVVLVVVDENGNVAEAEALSGPAPLFDAAVAAARRAKFYQTLLSGRPVKVTGVVTYNFVLR